MAEDDRVDAAVVAVDTDPEAEAEVAAITCLHSIKIKVYAGQLETTYLIMVRKVQKTRCRLLWRIVSTILAQYTGTASATNCRTKQRSPSARLNTLEM